MRFASYILVLLLLQGGNASAQQYLEAGFHLGSILRIDPDYPPNTQPTRFLSGGYSQRTTGRKEWHRLFGFPEWGVHAYYFTMGNPEVLGQALGLTPALYFTLTQNRLLHLQGGFEIGLAYLNRPYDPISNPTNNAIGSHLNNLTILQLRCFFFPGKAWQPFVGVAYPHFSNANAAVPNLGINVPSLSAGLRYQVQPAPSQPAFVPDSARSSQFRLRPGVRLGYGRTESKVGGGPSYPIWVGALYLQTVVRRKYRILLGTEWFFSHSSYAFLQNQDVDVPNRKWAATGGVIFVGAEMMLGHVAVSAYLGPYIKQAYQMPYTLYTKMGLSYHLADQQKHPFGHPFIGAYVHAHSGEADFFEMGMGYCF